MAFTPTALRKPPHHQYAVDMNGLIHATNVGGFYGFAFVLH